MIKKEQIIKKKNMLVKDDFFDDIVNGLKSSAEEHIDKENSDKSGTTFGSKQL
jgi:hypothetical protein